MVFHSNNRDFFSYKDLKLLAKIKNQICVSIYFPATLNPKKSAAEFSASIKQARESLQAFGKTKEKANQFLKPAQSLTDTPLFWKTQNQSLAIFISSKLFRFFFLPVNFTQTVTVAAQFHLKPLFPFLSGNGRFFLLRLNKNRLQLYAGTRTSFFDITPANLPKEFNDILPNKDFEPQTQMHGVPSRHKKEITHGHGGAPDQNKIELQRYFRQINKRLHTLLEYEKTPLIVSGVGYYVSLYQSINTYQYLLKNRFPENQNDTDVNSLHKKAFAIAQKYFDIQKYKDLKK